MTNPEQTPDMSEPKEEEVKAVAERLLNYWGEEDETWELYEVPARVCIRVLDEVRRK